MADQELSIAVRLRDFATKEIRTIGGEIQRFGKLAVAPFQALGKAVFSVQGAFAALGVGLTAKGLVDLVKSTADQADRLKDLSTELGVSTEALSELEFAAKQSGGNLDDLASAFRFLQKAAGEFRLQGTGPLLQVLGDLSPAFKQLVIDGASADKIFQQFSRDIQGFGAAEKVFIASKLFGKGGSPILATLAEDLDAARKSARFFGVTVTGEAAKAADDFNDSLGELGAALKGIAVQAIPAVLPELTKGLKELTKLIAESRPAILRYFADFAEGLGNIGEAVLTALGPLLQFERFLARREMAAAKKDVDALESSLRLLNKSGSLGSTGQTFTEGLVAQIKAKKAELDAAQKVLSEKITAFTAFNPIPPNVKASLDAIAASLRKLAGEQAVLGNAVSKTRSEEDQLLDLLSEPGFEQEKIRIQKEALAYAELGEAVTDYIGDIRDLSDAEIAAAIAAHDAEESRFRDSEAAAARVQAEIATRENAFTGASSAFAELRKQSTEWGVAAKQAVLGVADSISNNLSDNLIAVINGTKSAKQAFKDFAKSVLEDIQRIIIKLLIEKAIQATLGGLGGAIGFAKGGVVGGHLVPIVGHMAYGGVATNRGYYELREGGKNEAVVPLPDNRSIPVKVLGGGMSRGAAITNNYYINYTVNAPTLAIERQMIERNANTIADVIAKKNNSSLSFRESLAA